MRWYKLILICLVSILLTGCSSSIFTNSDAGKIKAVYFAPEKGGSLNVEELKKHPEVKVVKSFPLLKKATKDKVAIWIDKDTVDKIDGLWLDQMTKANYPLVLIGYNDAWYSFNEVLGVIKSHGPGWDGDLKAIQSGFSVYMLIKEIKTKNFETAQVYGDGFKQQPRVKDILAITNGLLAKEIPYPKEIVWFDGLYKKTDIVIKPTKLPLKLKKFSSIYGYWDFYVPEARTPKALMNRLYLKGKGGNFLVYQAKEMPKFYLHLTTFSPSLQGLKARLDLSGRIFLNNESQDLHLGKIESLTMESNKLDVYLGLPLTLKEGWVIQRDSFPSQMGQILQQVGLTQTEASALLKQWEDNLDWWDRKQCAVYWVDPQEVQKHLTLALPNKNLKIAEGYFYFFPLDEKINLKQPKLKPLQKKEAVRIIGLFVD